MDVYGIAGWFSDRSRMGIGDAVGLYKRLARRGGGFGNKKGGFT